MSETLTQEERDIARAAAFGAMALVSQADPGFLAMFKESMAGSKALAAAPPQIRELLQGGFITPPHGSADQVQSSVMEQLGQAVRILQGKSPELLDGFRGVVLAACDAVADASKGVAPEEAAMIDQVKGALSGNGGTLAPPPVPQDGPAEAGGGGLLGS